MQNRIRPVQHSTTTTLGQADEALRRVTAAQIGPRTPGTVYDNASGTFEVRAVITDLTEARRILKRNAARFAVLVRDIHAGTEHYTGATWTGSDRVLKAVTL
ncbi:hypothetical protein SAM23877_p014 (plasmid) [Streptomyces ambofaciens ATCC 23877]|uniref:Uncharacterized protein n=1 Tax=Streptomyces ambofaciens (strain ATCC 23877 / 3486 / DSM 40053 / JCM 4204 / NBRC 12836 / NRRL B-2516) TaxID=278992 RepID=A0A0K2B661_STRA7|nr:hypothetical protein [Streptomyces ambofaciens]AKZ60723.1 hypothetical protein SAM23877_p014 [Streptomyces ambofaciens ATCC 23877]